MKGNAILRFNKLVGYANNFNLKNDNKLKHKSFSIDNNVSDTLAQFLIKTRFPNHLIGDR